MRAVATRRSDAGVGPRRALVTGTSSGIGAAIAARLLRDGWEVTGLDRSPPPQQAAGFTPVEIDLLDAPRVTERVRQLGAMDALVHAAGVLRVAPLGALDAGDGRPMWRLHVDTAALLADLLAPGMPPGGRIVLIGSRTSAGAAGRSHYAATKAALVGMARSWATGAGAARHHGQRARAGRHRHADAAGHRARAVPPRTPPIGRFVRPEEVAALAAFVLSDDAAAITGQQLVICGGSSL